MSWIKHISDCRFMLDVTWITIVSNNPIKLVGQLGGYMAVGRTVLESKTKGPHLPYLFKFRTYLSYGPLKKMYLLHDKISAAQGIDALLVIHDVPLMPLLQIEQMLMQVSAVSVFHFCKVEFAWDFYPDRKITASELQQKIVQLLHIGHARVAWYQISSDRITHYINHRKSDLQGKVYVRPKRPDPTTIEFNRVELTANTRWLKSIGLSKPSDFLGLKFQQIVRQVKWLEFDWHELCGRNQHHLLSGGLWLARLINDWEFLGICDCIINRKIQKVCPPSCKHRGNPKLCLLFEAYSQYQVGSELIPRIQDCLYAIKQPRFVNDYCQPSKHHKFLMNTMEQAYKTWNRRPLFPVAIQASKINLDKKRKSQNRSSHSNQNKRKGGKNRKKKKSRIKLYELFKTTSNKGA